MGFSGNITAGNAAAGRNSAPTDEREFREGRAAEPAGYGRICYRAVAWRNKDTEEKEL